MLDGKGHIHSSDSFWLSVTETVIVEEAQETCISWNSYLCDNGLHTVRGMLIMENFLFWLGLVILCRKCLLSGFDDALVSLEKLMNLNFHLPTDLAIRPFHNIRDAFWVLLVIVKDSMPRFCGSNIKHIFRSVVVSQWCLYDRSVVNVHSRRWLWTAICSLHQYPVNRTWWTSVLIRNEPNFEYRSILVL